MTKVQKNQWQIIGLCLLGIVVGLMGIWFGLDRFDRYTMAFLKYRQIGKIAGGACIAIFSAYMLVSQIRKARKS